MEYLIKLKEAVLDIIFPPVCLYCSANLIAKEKETGFCDNCLSKIVIHTALFCPVCKARVPETKKICHKDSPFLLGAATEYNGLTKAIIHQFKYKKWTKISSLAGRFLIHYFNRLGPLNFQNFSFAPIPLHPKKKKERGFNQSELLGKILAEKYNLPLLTGVLSRDKETKPQAGLKDWQVRRQNLQNAFSVALPDQIKNKNIILIDDIYTSGATAQDAARALRQAGAKKIIVLVFAKA